jgi:membrane protease subunit HflC
VALRILIIALIVIVVAAFVGTETVRFNEKAVRATFGRATEQDVITRPGPVLRIPLLHKVTRYDTRLRLLQSDQETQQTADKSQLLVTSFLTWRVSDPLKFYKAFSHVGDAPRDQYREAEKILKPKLGFAASSVSRFRTSDLLASGEQAGRLPELEAMMLEKLRGSAPDPVPAGSAGATGGAPTQTAALAEYGIEAVAVGVMGIGLPQETTTKVFDRMRTSRDKIANEARGQGSSLAATIRADADADAKKILAFADQLAKSIQNQGELEAARFIERMNTDPQLAVFIQNMDFYRSTWGRNITLVIPTSTPGFNLLNFDTAAALKNGQVPGVGLTPLVQPAVQREPSAASGQAPGAGPTSSAD